jgi:hypothetical protein
MWNNFTLFWNILSYYFLKKHLLIN